MVFYFTSQYLILIFDYPSFADDLIGRVVPNPVKFKRNETIVFLKL